MSSIEIGRLLRAGTSGFVVGCRVTQLTTPSFGDLVRVPLDGDYQICGLIHDIHIEDDGLVRQLVTADEIDNTIILDNRLNRNVPVEMSVLSLGYELDGRIYHMLPPRPPLSLDVIYACTADEIKRFTSNNRFGYFRHILRARDLPAGELLATHLQKANQVYSQVENQVWLDMAIQELITLLRDDYAVLMSFLSAMGDAFHD
jgi:hypothetical protein